MDFKRPKTFNEKLQWLKLNDRNPLYTSLVDKQAVKSWVAGIIGWEHIIPTIGEYERIEDIDIDELPEKFVLKCTHDSGSVVLCSSKSNFSYESLYPLQKALSVNYYYCGREWPYKNIPHRIIAEPFISNEIDDIKDYKFFCFNNRVKIFKIDFDRHINHRANYYDRDGHILPFGETIFPPDYDKILEIPSNINDMIRYSEQLAEHIRSPFVRVDFYNVDGKILFGEITFYPAGGHGQFTEPGWDEKLGSWLII